MDTLIKRTKKFLGALLLTGTFLFVSCSEYNPVSATDDSTGIEMGTPHTPIDLIDLRLPEGYELLRSSSSLDECDSMVTSQNCRRLNLLSILGILDLTRLYVQGSDLPHNQIITMVMPNTCQAVVDLYPSPFEFNNNVELTWLLPQLRYGNLLNPNELAAFYVHEDGTTELADQNWGPLNLWLTVRTDHFSRYIIARRTN